MISRFVRLKIFLKGQHLSEGKRKQSSSLSRFLSLQWNCWVADPIRKWNCKRVMSIPHEYFILWPDT